MKVWMRECAAGASASPACWTSRALARAKPHTTLSVTASAMARTASKSPGLAAGKPASMTSTRRFSNCRATRSFSSKVMDAPGLCSPSRSVVSKIIKRSFMVVSRLRLRLRGRATNRAGAPAHRRRGRVQT